jgi:hypothetical protein
MKNWHKDIVKVSLGILDYGFEFPPAERYDYVVVTTDNKGKQDTVPGTFEEKRLARAKVKELAVRIADINKSPCEIGEDINLKDRLDENKARTPENRRKKAKRDAKINAAQRRKDNK